MSGSVQVRAFYCRCAALTLAFGNETMCQACTVAAKKEQLARDGFVVVSRTFMQAYRSAGVPVETVAIEGEVYAPDWATRIVWAGHDPSNKGFYPWLQRVLEKAAIDVGFRVSCLSIIMLTPADHDLQREKLEAFLVGLGI